MRKKALMFLGVAAILAIVFSVTAFAESEVPPVDLPIDMPETNYNLIEVIRQSLIMFLTSIFTAADKVYSLFAGLFG